MQIDFLAAHEAHLATVAAWQHTEFGYLNPSLSLAQRVDRLRESLQRARMPLTLVALRDDGEPVGAASLMPKSLTRPDLSPWLSMVVVPPAWRGRGIASALALRGAAEAARLGFETIHLFTPHKESLYARLGWCTFERSIHNDVPIALMARPTAASTGS